MQNGNRWWRRARSTTAVSSTLEFLDCQWFVHEKAVQGMPRWSKMHVLRQPISSPKQNEPKKSEKPWETNRFGQSLSWRRRKLRNQMRWGKHWTASNWQVYSALNVPNLGPYAKHFGLWSCVSKTALCWALCFAFAPVPSCSFCNPGLKLISHWWILSRWWIQLITVHCSGLFSNTEPLSDYLFEYV